MKRWVAAAIVFATGYIALPACAEPAAVGLEARGVDAWTALRNPGLDVRDAFNRPVSRALIEQQVLAAARKVAVRTVTASTLARAVLLHALEVLIGIGAALRPGAPPPARSASPLLPWTLKETTTLRFCLIFLIAVSALPLLTVATPVSVTVSPSRPVVLRC